MTQLSARLARSAELVRKAADGVVTERGIGPDDGAREMVFGRFVIDPDVSLPAHIHSADTIAYCVRGACSFRAGPDLDQHITMGPGDYVLIPAGTLHTEATGAEGVELIFARDKQGGTTTQADPLR